MSVGHVLVELSIVIILAVGISGVMRFFKQPLIIGYIITGILASPAFFNITTANDSLSTFSEIGIAFLLFTVGLGLNPKVIKNLGGTALVTGIAQIAITAIVAFITAQLFGFSITISSYIAIAITFSSTIIILKLLSDKRETETLHGRISLGILLLQDLVVVVILMVISSLSTGIDIGTLLYETILKSAGLVLILYFISHYILSKFIKYIAKSQEFLFLFSIGWSLILAMLFAFMNLSFEIGALVAGVMLSVTPYHHEIHAKMKPLRDFFIVIFFIYLGSQTTFGGIQQYAWHILFFAAFILIVKPILIILILRFLKYTKRTAFFTGITLAQISEFSFILLAIAIKSNVVGMTAEILSFMTFSGLISIAGSTYMIMHANQLYNLVSPLLSKIDRLPEKQEEGSSTTHAHSYDIILFGCDRLGWDLLETFTKIKNKFLVVDYNPDIIHKLTKMNYDATYGDVADIELLNSLNFMHTKMVISTLHDIDTDLLLIKKVKENNPDTIIITVAHQIDDSFELYNAGATYVIMPHFLGGKHTASMIEEFGLDAEKFLEQKVAHIEHLKRRKQQGHEHPTVESDK